jgi:hypothetical protein
VSWAMHGGVDLSWFQQEEAVFLRHWKGELCVLQACRQCAFPLFPLSGWL